MKIYLAARYSTKSEIEEKADELRSLGFKITSSWLKEAYSPTTTLDDVDPEILIAIAVEDIQDIERADVLVFFSVDPTTPTARGGRHVEFGFALGRGLPILVVGPLENIFHFLPSVEQVETWEEAKQWLLRKK